MINMIHDYKTRKTTYVFAYKKWLFWLGWCIVADIDSIVPKLYYDSNPMKYILPNHKLAFFTVSLTKNRCIKKIRNKLKEIDK